MFDAIRRILASADFSVVESFSIEGTPAKFEDTPDFLFSSTVGDYLSQQHHQGLWSHQAQALEALGHGENIVISTGTASGKSLVFQALAFHKILTDPSSKVLVFYPLRALVADQLRSWQGMAHDLSLDSGIVGRIDGTIPFQERDAVLERSNIIVMTPDVCHAWLMSRLAMPVVKDFVHALSTVVMDEAHTLEGVFGSNFAFLIRRLIAARNYLLGNEAPTRPIQLVAATATIANPGEHLKQLTGAEFSVIDHKIDGSTHYERIVAHIACPEGQELQLAKELQLRVLSEGNAGGFITFVDSRKGVETLTIATQEDVEQLSSHPAVVPYRAGYTAEQRQLIESQLRSGKRRGVVSTSALELGINLPHLRVGFNIGVPATRKAYRQRLGRVGRTSPGAFVVVGPPDSFRRYGTSFQEYHNMSVEPSHLYLDNRFMQFAHGRCLADERDALAAPASLPTRVGWPRGFGDVYQMARPGGNRPTEFDEMARLGADSPQRGYPLRNVGEINYQIKLGQDSESFGEASQSQALRECYPGAVYFHNARAYEVMAWHTNVFQPFLRVKHTSPRRATRPQITTWINTGISETEIIQDHFLKGENGFLAECQMLITERVEGYIDGKGQVRRYQDLRQYNPNMQARVRNFRTSGIVLCIEKDWFRDSNVRRDVADWLRELFAHEYSILAQDIGSAAAHISIRDSLEGRSRNRAVVIFDNTYGSLRFTEKLYLEFDHILDRLRVAATGETQEIIERIQEEYCSFSQGTAAGVLASEAPKGYEEVFSTGSRVCFNQVGQIATEVKIIEPTIMDGKLMYRVLVEAQPSQAPMRRWIPASACQPSGDADAWSYAWWNRETETYEESPDFEE